MKIAVLGDIHGNIEALKAAYEVARMERPIEILHLGDLGGYAPQVNEVVDFLMERNVRGVQGNYDYNVAAGSDHCGCKYDDPDQARIASNSFEWTKLHASAKAKDYMRALPQSIELSAAGRIVKIFHATPHKNNLYWHKDRPDDFFEEMAQKAGADIMIYGHTHRPYRKDLKGRVFINAGSTGKPKDGDSRACIAIVDIMPDGVECRFLRVAYDVDKTASAILSSSLPSRLADQLRDAR